MRWLFAGMTLAAFLSFGAPRAVAETVDLALVLAADVSRSVDDGGAAEREASGSIAPIRSRGDLGANRSEA